MCVCVCLCGLALADFFVCDNLFYVVPYKDLRFYTKASQMIIYMDLFGTTYLVFYWKCTIVYFENFWKCKKKWGFEKLYIKAKSWYQTHQYRKYETRKRLLEN